MMTVMIIVVTSVIEVRAAAADREGLGPSHADTDRD